MFAYEFEVGILSLQSFLIFISTWQLFLNRIVINTKKSSEVITGLFKKIFSAF